MYFSEKIQTSSNNDVYVSFVFVKKPQGTVKFNNKEYDFK